MNTKARLLGAGCIAGLALASSVLLATGVPNGLQGKATALESPTNSIFTWDGISKATNVAANASEASFVFNLTNVTSAKIVINDIFTSCGCTTVEVPTLPWTVVPGTNGQIAVTVNIADAEGTVSKTVDVVTDKGTDVLTAEVTINPAATH